MLKAPYFNSSKNGCAVACAQMISCYFEPEADPNEIKKILRWVDGYATWLFPVWLWLINKNIKIINYDLIDYSAWAKNGIQGLKNSLPQKEYDYYLEYTKDLNSYTNEINELLVDPSFTYYRQKPTAEILLDAVKNQKLCECVLDSHALDQVPGFALHRVIVLGFEDNNFIIHDPRQTLDYSYRKVSYEIFTNAWLNVLDAPELCIYSKGL